MNNTILDKSAERHLQILRRIEKMKLIAPRTLKSGLFYWETYFTIDGKRIRQKIPAFNKSQKAEAKAFAKELYMRMMRGEIFEKCTTSFKDMSVIYLQDKTINDASKKYRLAIIHKFIGGMSLDKICHRDYEAIKNYLIKERKNKRQTVNTYFADIGAILELAKRQRIIKDYHNPIKLDEDPKREVRALADWELDKIKKDLPNYMKDPFEFAWRTGLRRANLVGLTRNHLIKRKDGKYILKFTKEEMKAKKPFEHICTLEETEIIKRNLSFTDPIIFRREAKVNGAKTTGLGDFKKVIITNRDNVGIYWTWHWLRHTCATNYAKLGLNEQQMNTLMAWSPKSRMAGNYTHLRDEDYLAKLREETENLRHVNATRNEFGQSS